MSTRAPEVAFLLCCATACASSSSPPSWSGPTADGASYTWEETAPAGSGVFPDEWSEGRWPMALVPLVAFDHRLWMTGQTAAWSSSDALVWARRSKEDWGERIGAGDAWFDGKLWMSGGLRYPDNVFLNDVWSSSDGSHWQTAGNAAWPARKGHTLLAFQDALWLFGGADAIHPDRTSRSFVNDVWKSADGVEFTRVTEHAPWSPRELPRVIVFNKVLHLVGGQGHADVWTSPDGVAWTELLTEAPWGKRWDYGALVFDDKIWVFGGREEESTNAHADVWYSTDGRTWHQQVERAPWTARSGVHSVVFDERLWIFSGKHTGAPDNWAGDIWTMRKTAAASP